MYGMIDYPYLSEALSNIIETVRKERKMTKFALAEFSWLERKYLREIERGSKRPTVNAVYSICEALKIPPDAFFMRVEAERRRLEADAKARDAGAAQTTGSRAHLTKNSPHR